jgi:hypothetical protein
MRKIIDHDFVAHGELYKDDLSVPVTIRRAYSEFEHKDMRCLVIPTSKEPKQSFQPFFNDHRLGYLKGVTQDGESIWISALSFVSGNHSKDMFFWEGIAETFIKGELGDFDASDGEIHCELFIPPTPLALTHGYFLNSDGTVCFEKPEYKREGISWITKYGNTELIDGFYYAEQQVGVNPSIVRIRRCKISFVVHYTGITSLTQILQDAAETFDDTLWLISFLSRKYLAWYAGDALFMPSDHSKLYPQHAIVRRNKNSRIGIPKEYGEHEFDLLISSDHLKKGLFQKLLINYEQSKYKDAIRRAIMHVLVSFDDGGYFETNIGVSYLAIETLVAGLSSDKNKSDNKIITDHNFGDLTTKIKQTISQEISDTNTAAKIIKNIEKLNYAESPSLADRLLSLLRQYNVPLERLWPPGTKVDTELRKIIRRRNLYIHKGEVDNFDQYLYDFARLRTLVELWILKLLDCPDDVINKDYLTNLAPIDRVVSP